MRKQLILAAILALFAISCHKPDNTPPPINEYFRGKLNGVFFSDSTWANISTTTGPRRVPQFTLIEGHYSHGSIILYPNGTITLKVSPYITIGESLLYQQGILEGITITQYQPYGFFFAGSMYGKVQGSGKINILEITNGYVRGTFESIAPADSTMATILPTMYITEGEFKLKWE